MFAEANLSFGFKTVNRRRGCCCATDCCVGSSRAIAERRRGLAPSLDLRWVTSRDGRQPNGLEPALGARAFRFGTAPRRLGSADGMDNRSAD
jgi:hypothetical protein